MCERCADLMFSLTELGYCAAPWEDQRELVAEYADMHALTVTPNVELYTGGQYDDSF